MLRRGDTRAEAGFTLIELVVGMVLSLIVIGMLFGAIIEIFGSSDRTAARSEAQRSATKAADLLASDLRDARAVRRTPREYGSPDSLRQLILQEFDGDGMAVHDIQIATGNQLRFFSDVDREARGTECVTWSAHATNGSMLRTVHALGPGPNRGCNLAGNPGGALLSKAQVIPARPAMAAGEAVAPFAYTILAVGDPNDPDPSTCTTKDVAIPPGRLGRDQVIAVRLDLDMLVGRRAATGTQRQVTAISLATRQSTEYRYALGCAE